MPDLYGFEKSTERLPLFRPAITGFSRSPSAHCRQLLRGATWRYKRGHIHSLKCCHPEGRLVKVTPAGCASGRGS